MFLYTLIIHRLVSCIIMRLSELFHNTIYKLRASIARVLMHYKNIFPPLRLVLQIAHSDKGICLMYSERKVEIKPKATCARVNERKIAPTISRFIYFVDTLCGLICHGLNHNKFPLRSKQLQISHEYRDYESMTMFHWTCQINFSMWTCDVLTHVYENFYWNCHSTDYHLLNAILFQERKKT